MPDLPRMHPLSGTALASIAFLLWITVETVRTYHDAPVISEAPRRALFDALGAVPDDVDPHGAAWRTTLDALDQRRDHALNAILERPELDDAAWDDAERQSITNDDLAVLHELISATPRAPIAACTAPGSIPVAITFGATWLPRGLQLACAREIEAGRVESARLAFEILVGLNEWQAAIPSSMGVLLLSRQLESTMRAARSMLASGHLTRHDLDWLQANLARACALDLERVLEIAALIERVQQRTRYGSRGYLRPEMAPTLVGDRTLLTSGHPPSLGNACAARFVEFTRAEHNAAYAAAARAMVAAYAHADHDDRTAELATWLESAARDPRARFLVSDVRLWIDMWGAHEAAVADVHATMLLCAIARAIDDHGVPPEALDDLVPDYLAAVPIDRRTGRPFSYARCHDAPGYDLWSRGPNGIDDPHPRATVETAGTYRFRYTDDIEWTPRTTTPPGS